MLAVALLRLVQHAYYTFFRRVVGKLVSLSAGLLTALFALIKMTVSHLWMFVELGEVFHLSALDAPLTMRRFYFYHIADLPERKVCHHRSHTVLDSDPSGHLPRHLQEERLQCFAV